MKKMILSALTLWSFAAFAQEETTAPSMSAPEPSAASEKTWTRAGLISLMFNQTAFNHDWTGGVPITTEETSTFPTMPTIKKVLGHGITNSLWITVLLK